MAKNLGMMAPRGAWFLSRDPAHQYAARVEAERLGVSGLRVLDVGCSDGWMLDCLAEYGAQPTGITICRAEARHARYRGTTNIVVADMHAMPFRTGCFDLVWCRHVLEHALAPLLVLREIARCADRSFIVLPSVADWTDDPYHILVPDHQQLLALGTKAGLVVETFWNMDSDRCYLFAREGKGS